MAYLCADRTVKAGTVAYLCVDLDCFQIKYYLCSQSCITSSTGVHLGLDSCTDLEKEITDT